MRKNPDNTDILAWLALAGVGGYAVYKWWEGRDELKPPSPEPEDQIDAEIQSLVIY